MEKEQSQSKTVPLIIKNITFNNERKVGRKVEKFPKTINCNDTAMKNKNQIVRQLMG